VVVDFLVWGGVDFRFLIFVISFCGDKSVIIIGVGSHAMSVREVKT
jgi:hypothetical protein